MFILFLILKYENVCLNSKDFNKFYNKEIYMIKQYVDILFLVFFLCSFYIFSYIIKIKL